jgi:hypothetical protein
MAEQPKQRLDLSDFPGLMVYTDEGTTPPGSAVEQTNMTALVVGQIQVRRGYTIVQFED